MSDGMRSKDEETESSPFCLRTAGDSFVSRTKDVFSGLTALEDQHSAFVKNKHLTQTDGNDGFMKEDPDEEENFSQIRDRDKRQDRSRSFDRHRGSSGPGYLRGTDQESRDRTRSLDRDRSSAARSEYNSKDDIFRRPRRPTNRPRRQAVPDFRVNPEKWTCYSLEDVPDQDLSERANKKAALQFLEQRRRDRERLERKAAGLPEEELKFDVGYAACSQGKISFSRPKAHETHGEELPAASKGSEASEKGCKLLASGLAQEDIEADLETVDVGAGKGSETNPTTQDDNKNDMEGSAGQFHSRSKKISKRHFRRKEAEEDGDE